MTQNNDAEDGTYDEHNAHGQYWMWAGGKGVVVL
jgi:hypothetical protein